MVTNALAWLIQLCSHCQEAEEDINLLADPRHNEETIDIDITHLPEYSNPHCKNTSELFWEMTQDATLQNILI
jgi:7,8-dihydro-6-hydroxymethylpterin-pyrophosphokinase